MSCGSCNFIHHSWDATATSSSSTPSLKTCLRSCFPIGRGVRAIVEVRCARFLAMNDRFVIDRMIQDKLLVTVAPDGYLKCVKD